MYLAKVAWILIYSVLLNLGLKDAIYEIFKVRIKYYFSPAGVIAVCVIPTPRSLVTPLTRASLSYLQFKR